MTLVVSLDASSLFHIGATTRKLMFLLNYVWQYRIFSYRFKFDKTEFFIILKFFQVFPIDLNELSQFIKDSIHCVKAYRLGDSTMFATGVKAWQPKSCTASALYTVSTRKVSARS